MSYTIFDRICDSVSDALYDGIGSEKTELIWETEVDPILDSFSEAERRVWAKVSGLIARYSGEEGP